MKTATVKEIKTELYHRSPDEIIELCLRLSKFKTENKELLTYLLFESDQEDSYIENIKNEIDSHFETINFSSYYYIKKSIRKILRIIKKYIRYSKKTETEVELLLHFCKKFKNITPPIQESTVLQNIYNREINTIQKKLKNLHSDLQHDYNLELEEIMF
ncbi:hypothetical protein [Aquimarina sp. 2201CG5-10]|uniref:hypothetical protein n=1 Tax=Aquimarina callyspongiae TaxID=3098150 RepID=UPI002AB59CBB|nr:hypothetical protein [Aquimarina sp. 2201CG5-10]MDY8136334.1 hypothetical protein [Aquimarina sp. 2201CG5-10]